MTPHYQQQFYLRPSFITFFNFSHKRPTFAFTSESGYTLGFAQRIAHSGSHGETRGVSDGGGITTLGAFHTVRKPCVAGYQNGKLCRFWVLAGCTSEGRRKPSGQRCAYACRCPEGVAAPLGCVICLQLGDVAVFSLCAQYFLNVRGGGGITTLGAFHTFRKPCVAGCQNGVLWRFWVSVEGTPEERKEPSGQRCAYACRCSEASRPRWAAHTYAVNTSIFPAEFFSHSQKAGKKSHSLMFHIHVFDCTA